MKQILFSIIVLSISLAAYTDTSSYETISIDAVLEYQEKGYQIVDVREIDEYLSGHIPYALNVPLSKLEKGEFGSLKKEGKYIIICRSGNRSKVASEILTNQAFEVLNVDKGMSSWTGEIGNN